MKTTVFHKPYPLWIKIILAVYMIAFAAATWNHVADFIVGGLLPYDKYWNVPCWMNVYWTSLTILDPLAILVLLFYLRPGLDMYFIIIISDVIKICMQITLSGTYHYLKTFFWLARYCSFCFCAYPPHYSETTCIFKFRSAKRISFSRSYPMIFNRVFRDVTFPTQTTNRERI